MPLKLITPATEEPISLAEFKQHLRVDAMRADEDYDLESKLLAARVHVEDEMRRALLTSTWDLFLDAFPCKREIRLPLGNLQEVESVNYWLRDGSQQTFSPSLYEVDGASEPGRIVLAPGACWPSDCLRSANGVNVRFTCGWLTPADIPASIKLAIELLAATWYRNRESVIVGNTAAAVSSKLADGVDALIGKWCFRSI